MHEPSGNESPQPLSIVSRLKKDACILLFTTYLGAKANTTMKATFCCYHNSNETLDTV